MWPGVTRSMNKAVGIGGLSIDQRGMKNPSCRGREVQRRLERDDLAGSGMPHRELGRMQINPRGRSAAIKDVAKNRKTQLRRMNSNLMRPAGQRLCLHKIEHRRAQLAFRALCV